MFLPYLCLCISLPKTLILHMERKSINQVWSPNSKTLMSMHRSNHRSRTFKFMHLEHFSLFSVILWFMFSYFNFSFYVSVILNFSTLTCLLVPKACLNCELIENDMQWIALVWNECLRMIWMSNCMIWITDKGRK